MHPTFQYVDLGAFDIQLDEIQLWNLELRKNIVQRLHINVMLRDDDGIVAIKQATEIAHIRSV